MAASILNYLEQPTHHHARRSEHIAHTIISTGLQAASGALAGYLFEIILPVGGGVFGGSMGITHGILGPALDGAFGKGTDAKVIEFVIKFFTAILIGTLITMALGFPITFIVGLELAVLMIPVSIVTNVAYKHFADAIR